MSDVLKNRVETIIDALELIGQRMTNINKPSGFISTDQGLLSMDGITMRLQVIGETVKKINQENPKLFPKFNTAPHSSHHENGFEYRELVDISVLSEYLKNLK